MELLTEPSTTSEASSSTQTTKTESSSQSQKYTNPEIEVKASESESSQSAKGANDENDDLQTYEGVASDDFSDFTGELIPMVQGLSAAAFVLVWVMFFLAGIMAVQTLVRSLE